MSPAEEESYISECPSGGLCSRLPADCIHCNYHHNCTYKKQTSFTCKPKKGVNCIVSSSSYYAWSLLPVILCFSLSCDDLFVFLGGVRTAANELYSLHLLSVLLAAGPVPVSLLKLHQLYDSVMPPQALQRHL